MENESVFNESLYEPEDLAELNLKVKNGHLDMLTCGWQPERWTPAIEKDIERVLKILRPQIVQPTFKDVYQKALESKKAIVKKVVTEDGQEEEKEKLPALEAPKKMGRPKKVVVNVAEQAV